MHILPAVDLLLAALNFGTGVYVLSKNPGSAINRAFFIFVVGIVGGEIGTVFIMTTGSAFWITPTLLSSELSVFGLVMISEIFPDGNSLGASFFWLMTPLFIISTLTLSEFIVRSAKLSLPGYLKPGIGMLFPLFAIGIGFFIFFSFYRLLKKYRKAFGIRRVQLRYLITGIGTFVLAGFLFDIALPAFHIFTFNLLGPLFSVFFLGFTGYAIARYDLLDVRFIIKRSISYACVIIVVALVFFCVEFIVEKFYSNDEIVDISAAVVGAFAFTWLRTIFEKITDTIFFRKDYDYADSVYALGPILNSTIELSKLLVAMKDFLGKTIKPRLTIFLLASAAEPITFDSYREGNEVSQNEDYRLLASPFWGSHRNTVIVHQVERATNENRSSDFFDKNLIAMARRNGIIAIVPFRTNDQVNAVMLLGEKLSDDVLRPKDIKLLAVISHQGGMAIENARLYEAIRKHNETLEDLVDERTKAVKNEYESRADFLTDISHQLQTPIAILQGNLELAERQHGKPIGNSLRIMKETLEEMSHNVRGFLEIARLNFSKNKFHKDHFDVGVLVQETYEDCLVLAETKTITLRCFSSVLFIAGERRKIKEVLLNLVSNALKHTPRSGSITLNAKARDGYAEIEVRDTGVGIPSENLSHIFERFYRIPGAETVGSGLGLNICRQIIEFHQGTIAVRSTVGRGSEFTVRLPLAP